VETKQGKIHWGTFLEKGAVLTNFRQHRLLKSLFSHSTEDSDSSFSNFL